MFIIMRKKTLEAIKKNESIAGKLEGIAYEREQREIYLRQKSDDEVGKFIIAVGNEHCNPYIGQVKGHFQLGVPIIDCLIHGDERIIMGAYKIFTPQVFEALMKLTPEERAAMMFANLYNGREVVFNKELSCAEEILTPEQIKNILKEKGFDYEKFQ